VSDPKEPSLRVVDRRWWARQDSEETTPEPIAEPLEVKPSGREALEAELMRAQEQVQAVLSEYRRATEEFEQVKQRMRRDVGREVERGRRAVLVEMLEVVDNLDRAIDAASESGSDETLLQGIEMVRAQFLGKLEQFGVMRLDVLGQPFDPQQHEAVSMAPVEDPAHNGLIVAVAREGYAIGEELLRPAAVVVATCG
jgi:molecular chaperone GrpE